MNTITTATAAAFARRGTGFDGVRRSDQICRDAARRHLADLVGAPDVTVAWDDRHRLRGHVKVDGRELVVIAPRDDVHPTLVVTAEDWDAIRISADDRRSFLAAPSSADGARLSAVA